MEVYIDQAIDIVIDGLLKVKPQTSAVGTVLSEVESADQEILHLKRSLTTCLATFGVRFKRALIPKAKQRNSLLPISRLPTEVLIRIFKDYTDSYRSPRSLTMVCTAWSRIVLDSPTLWSHVNSRSPPLAFLSSLSRSRDIPLDVTYCGSGHRGGDDSEDIEELEQFIDAVGGQVHRWRSATLLMDYEPTLSGALMRYLITNPTPLLEKLDIVDGEARYPPGFNWFDAFSQKVAPRLRHLELKEFPFLWDSSLLSHLHSLKVYGNESSGLSTSQLVQILRACPI
ncbi:hypothetical protein FRB96_009105 [Tulasnella sp. 330]|nr:hypothetical protein FRB96_009105 [Tulasnella sp. 330]